MQKVPTEFPTELIIIWVICIAAFIYLLISYWFQADKKDSDYITRTDERLLDDLSMMGVNDE